MTEKWEKERSEIQAIKKIKEDLEKARYELEEAQRNNDFGRAGELRYSVIPAMEAKVEGESKESSEGTLIHDSVTADDIANVVSRVTGIPISKLTSGHAEKLIHMEESLRESVRGQDEALSAVANSVRMQRAGLNGENRPLASFFFLGPTGKFSISVIHELTSRLGLTIQC